MRLARRLGTVIAVLLPAALGCGTVAGGARSALLPPGAVAPHVEAADQSGTTRTLAEYRGRPVVIFFYPRDGTPGCTKEACTFRDAWPRYQQAGVAIVGISTDGVQAHARFADEHKLPFALLADTDAAIARAYGVDVTFGLTKRVSFLIDAEGRIARVFPNVDPGVHATEVLEAAAALYVPVPPPPASG